MVSSGFGIYLLIIVPTRTIIPNCNAIPDFFIYNYTKTISICYKKRELIFTSSLFNYVQFILHSYSVNLMTPSSLADTIEPVTTVARAVVTRPAVFASNFAVTSAISTPC